MLNYSREGLAARPAFFAPYSDITIIVEDRGKENFYSEVINRLLDGQHKTAKVLGVGGKSQVLRRLAERDAAGQNWKEFYLVDGDFDEILGIGFSESIYSYRLRRYDIESYLVEELAICTIAAEENPRIALDEFQATLNVGRWIPEVVNTTIRLAACAALIQELDQHNLRIVTNIREYAPGLQTLPDVSLIEKQIGLVKEALTVLEVEEFEDRLEIMLERMGNSTEHQLRWISGKDILIPLIIHMIRKCMRGNRNLSKESVCFRLAKVCTFEELHELRDRILAVV